MCIHSTVVVYLLAMQERAVRFRLDAFYFRTNFASVSWLQGDDAELPVSDSGAKIGQSKKAAANRARGAPRDASRDSKYHQARGADEGGASASRTEHVQTRPGSGGGAADSLLDVDMLQAASQLADLLATSSALR
jgi:hypothetical protein